MSNAERKFLKFFCAVENHTYCALYTLYSIKKTAIFRRNRAIFAKKLSCFNFDIILQKVEVIIQLLCHEQVYNISE